MNNWKTLRTILGTESKESLSIVVRVNTDLVAQSNNQSISQFIQNIQAVPDHVLSISSSLQLCVTVPSCWNKIGQMGVERF